MFMCLTHEKDCDKDQKPIQETDSKGREARNVKVRKPLVRIYLLN